jgi:hypothetical protein
MENDIFRGVGIEVELLKDFLIIMRTLERMGVSSKKNKILYQSCHILHKQGRYSILHFKELFMLDGKHSNLSESDIQRRNTIVKLLSEWELVKIKDGRKFTQIELTPIHQIKILSDSESKNWELVSKYNIGKVSNS